ncbi:hypothetical protein POPA111323_09530 [Polynucleobacter paneuropaeus]|uniref:Uncharacterized protein n=1 Tax=Polynucleobacter paneuropaeus TaxID=2527775 RepID=A0A2Z4JTV1_9BURK|nr:hypothetical protein [Polynucleobacter paneuropaeus]AWW50221.1 hypothetical protein Pas1_07425 [Polynucleobacter paneuropaeus]
MIKLDIAIKALKNLDTSAFMEIVAYLNKEQIQDLALKCKAISANIYMSGSWVEKSKADLIDPAIGSLIYQDVPYESEFEGELIQQYITESLHLASIVCLDQNIQYDFDEDYFESGSMKFGLDYEYPADLVKIKSTCKYQKLSLKDDEIEEAGLSEFKYTLDQGKHPSELSSASIFANSIEILFDHKKSMRFPLKGSNYSLIWFLFSVLFMSSNKTVAEISFANGKTIKDFIWDNFGIFIE